MFLRDHRVSCTGTASYHASQLDIAVSIAVGMELSRVYLGVHYPSDIAAGYLVRFYG
jgi:membrane-associated phospholipid phosphatase